MEYGFQKRALANNSTLIKDIAAALGIPILRQILSHNRSGAKKFR